MLKIREDLRKGLMITGIIFSNSSLKTYTLTSSHQPGITTKIFSVFFFLFFFAD